jgi:hypothetical protein
MIRRVAVLVGAVLLLAGCAPQPSVSESDQILASAYEEQLSDLQVTGSGIAVRILEDDNNEGRHQRFILELDSGQTLLIAHNIDVAPRIPVLLVGDKVEFSGVYEWNDEGGVIHWTHHDPEGVHEAGWLVHKDLLYQ